MNPSDAASEGTEGAERPPEVEDGASEGRQEASCGFEPPADGPQAPPAPPSGVPGGQPYGQPYVPGGSSWASWFQPEGPFGSLSKTAMILSITAVVSLFTPLNSLSWAAAVGGIVLGLHREGQGTRAAKQVARRDPDRIRVLCGDARHDGRGDGLVRRPGVFEKVKAGGPTRSRSSRGFPWSDAGAPPTLGAARSGPGEKRGRL